MGETIGDLIEWSAHNYPNKTALIYERKGQRWTFKVFNEKVNQFASSLQTLGVKKGDVVSVFLYNSSEFVVTLFAAAKIGAIFNPINYRLSASELQFILNDAKSKVLVYEKAVSTTVEKTKSLGVGVEHHVFVDEPVPDDANDFYQLLEQGDKAPIDIELTEDDDYIMMYTSGTTGKPKGVLHRHRDMVSHGLLMIQCMGLNKNDIGLSFAPLNHTAELHTSFIPRVQVGATNIILHAFEPRDVLKTIEREKVTHAFAAPTMVNMLVNDKHLASYDLSTLRLLGYGGASMSPALIRQFTDEVGADLVQMYGTTEMGPVMTVLYPDEQLDKAGSAGKAMLSHKVKIAKVTNDEVPTHPDDECAVGEVGEILVKGPCVMKGYYNRPEATEKALAHGWYHTGDMAFYDEEGYIWIKDRIDFMIVTGAENVYPREIEDCLAEHPEVLEAGIVGKPDPKWGEIVVAFVVLKAGSQLTGQDLDRFLTEGDRLATYKRPREYHFIEQLPKTASGKIQKFVLENKFSETV